MLGPVIAQTQKYVNIILEPSAVTADSIQKAFHGADEYLISLDYSQTTGAEEINFLYLDSEPTDIEIKYSGKPRLNRDIISAKKYVTIHLEGDDFELKNADYLFQCGEYLVGDIDLSKIKKVTSMRKAFDGDTNVTNVTIDKDAVVNAAYTFRNTSLEKLDMNEFRTNLPAESYEGIISGVTSLKEITIDNRSSLIWNDVKANLSNDIKVFSANKCNYIDTLNCTNWSACEIFEVGSEHLESLTLFSNKSALKSFVLKAPQLNIGSSLSISAGELERFELETAGLETLTLVSEKLKSVDLSKCRTLTSFDFTTPLLEELDVSNTAITELNLLKFTNLKAPGSYKDILGWYAKNCTELRNVLIRMDQVRADVSDSPLQLDRCTALQNVTVYTDSAGETGGLEYHYGTEYHYGRMFLNDKEIQPGGGGSANIVEITQAEYDKLTPSERKDIVYMITDGVPGSGGGDDLSDLFVSVEDQNFTEAQKTKARTNIGIQKDWSYIGSVNVKSSGQTGSIDVSQYNEVRIVMSPKDSVYNLVTNFYYPKDPLKFNYVCFTSYFQANGITYHTNIFLNVVNNIFNGCVAFNITGYSEVVFYFFGKK